MTPREYIEAVVRPNLADLEKDEGDIRHALNAVHAVDSLAARIHRAASGRATIGARDNYTLRSQAVNSKLMKVRRLKSARQFNGGSRRALGAIRASSSWMDRH